MDLINLFNNDFNAEFNSGLQFDSEFASINFDQVLLTQVHNTVEDKMKKVRSNLHLIDKCLATKRTDILPAYELRKYGVVALRTAALDFEEIGEFEDFASNRIESLMNRAIAEAHMLTILSAESLEEDRIHKEFTSIHNRFSTLLF